MSEEKQSLFYPLQDGFSEAILLTRGNNSSTKHAYKSGFIRPKKGSITVSDRPLYSNSQRDSSHGHQEVTSPQRKSARTRHVTMWPFNRQKDQASTSSNLDKGKQLMSEARQKSENDNISDEAKKFEKFVAVYKDFLHKLNGDEKDIEEYSTFLEKEFIETNENERKKYFEGLKKDFNMIEEIYEKMGDLFENKAKNIYKSEESKEESKDIEKLQEIRRKFLKVLEAKIKNSSDKKETFGSWTRVIDQLYSDRGLIKEGYYNAIGRDIAMIYSPTSITDREPGEVKAGHCEGNDQIYKYLTRICDSLYPEFKERKRLGELRAQIERIEMRYRNSQSNVDGISVVSMKTEEIAEYSDLLFKETQRCVKQGEQVEREQAKQLRQEAKKLRLGLEKYGIHVGELEDLQPKSENLNKVYENVRNINIMFKEYDNQRQSWRLRF